MGFATIFHVSAFLTPFVATYMTAGLQRSQASIVFELVLGHLFSIVGTILFYMFCKKIAQNIGSYQFEDAVGVGMKWYLINITIAILGAVVLYSELTDKMTLPTGFVVLVGIILGLPLLVTSIISLTKQIVMMRTGIEDLAA